MLTGNKYIYWYKTKSKNSFFVVKCVKNGSLIRRVFSKLDDAIEFRNSLGEDVYNKPKNFHTVRSKRKTSLLPPGISYISYSYLCDKRDKLVHVEAFKVCGGRKTLFDKKQIFKRVYINTKRSFIEAYQEALKVRQDILQNKRDI